MICWTDFLTEGVKDGWRWKSTSDGIYKTKDAYNHLMRVVDTNRDGERVGKEFDMVWSSFTPHKATTIAWRLMRDRLSTRSNLRKRRIIARDDEEICTTYREVSESATHIFLEFNLTNDIWVDIPKWLNIPSVMHNQIKVHFMHFSSLFWKKKKS